MEESKRTGGPRTDEGKAICSMNALKNGKYMRRFERLNGKTAGKLAICEYCAAEQKAECAAAEKCLIWEQKVIDYHMSHEKCDPAFHEKHTLAQLAALDMFLDHLINDTAANIGKEEPLFNKDGEVVGNKPKIGTDRYYVLLNMLSTLKKTPADLNLTRQTMEGLEMQFAEMFASANPAAAMAARDMIIDSMTRFRSAKIKANEMREQDEALDGYLKNIGETPDDDGMDAPAKPGANPFGARHD